MKAIFGIFTNIIYEYMIFYMSQTSLKTQCQKWIKKGPKRGKREKLKRPIGIQEFLVYAKIIKKSKKRGEKGDAIFE